MRPMYIHLLVMLLALISEGQTFEKFKHKFKFNKLAKLAFAARLLAPHLIPLPVPFPIRRRHRNKQHFKVVEVEEQPWKGQGWPNDAGGWPNEVRGWQFNHNLDHGDWNIESKNGWHQMQYWQPELNLHGSWATPHDFNEQAQSVLFRQRAISSLKAGQIDTDHRAENEAQHSHQIEIREELVPVLKAAGFIEHPSGVMVKLPTDQRSAASPAGSRGQESTSELSAPEMPEQNAAQSSTAQRWPSSQMGDVQELHGDATNSSELENNEPQTLAKHSGSDSDRFDVEHSGDFEQFDVSNVQVEAIEAPPREKIQIDPWPANVAYDTSTETSAVALHSDPDHQAEMRTEAESVSGANEFGHVIPNDKFISEAEYHQAQGSTMYDAKLIPSEVGHSFSYEHSKGDAEDWRPLVTSDGQARAVTTARDAHKKR